MKNDHAGFSQHKTSMYICINMYNMYIYVYLIKNTHISVRLAVYTYTQMMFNAMKQISFIEKN